MEIEEPCRHAALADQTAGQRQAPQDAGRDGRPSDDPTRPGDVPRELLGDGNHRWHSWTTSTRSAVISQALTWAARSTAMTSAGPAMIAALASASPRAAL